MKPEVNKALKKYIIDHILPEYELNDKGHSIEHINFVLERAYELAKTYTIDYNMLYTIVCFHDVACHIDRKQHEKISAMRLYFDKKLREFFNEEQLIIMKEAVEDHRASLEYIPRNIYGKILSSADRRVEINEYLKSSMSFSLKRNPNISEDELIEESYLFAIKKFGKNGYATTKMYVEDIKYEMFLKEIQYLIDNKEQFIIKAKEILKNM